jgi:cation diffusion facilitator CzcD-associated flavoprotein CzcO
MLQCEMSGTILRPEDGFPKCFGVDVRSLGRNVLRRRFMSESSPRIAVIEAGPSGIAAAKECIQAGLGDGLVVFEKSDQVGGNWAYREKPSHRRFATRSHIRTSSLSDRPDIPPESTTRISGRSCSRN